jgi:hypothetical protein
MGALLARRAVFRINVKHHNKGWEPEKARPAGLFAESVHYLFNLQQQRLYVEVWLPRVQKPTGRKEFRIKE